MADTIKYTAITYGMDDQVSLHPILQSSAHSCWPSSAKVMNECSYSSTPPICLHYMDKNSFTFHLYLTIHIASQGAHSLCVLHIILYRGTYLSVISSLNMTAVASTLQHMKNVLDVNLRSIFTPTVQLTSLHVSLKFWSTSDFYVCPTTSESVSWHTTQFSSQ